MRDLLEEFTELQLNAALRDNRNKSDGWNAVNEARLSQFTPEYVSELRSYLATQASEPDPARYQLNGAPISFDFGLQAGSISVYLNETALPTGELLLNGHTFRLAFRGYEFAMDKCFSASTKEWRGWMHETYGVHYRVLEQCSDSDDLNVKACMSPLFHEKDLFAKQQAIVRDAIVYLIWKTRGVSAWLLLGQRSYAASAMRKYETTYTGRFR